MSPDEQRRTDKMNIKTNIRAGKQSGTVASGNSTSTDSSSSTDVSGKTVAVPVYTRCGV
jgi:class 3 adenylate cyclase